MFTNHVRNCLKYNFACCLFSLVKCYLLAHYRTAKWINAFSDDDEEEEEGEHNSTKDVEIDRKNTSVMNKEIGFFDKFWELQVSLE